MARIMSSGSEVRVRQRVLRIRLADDENDAVRSAADAAGLTPASFARRAILGAPASRQVRRPPLGRSLAAEIIGRLGVVADGLREVRRAVATARADRELAALLTEIAETLTTIRDALMQALGRAP
jgi:hypothetical protein